MAKDQARLVTGSHHGIHPRELGQIFISPNSCAQQIAELGGACSPGDISWRRERLPAAIAAFREGGALEDRLGYNEPEDWYYPARLLLGAVLLEAGRPREAAAAYREDLAKHQAERLRRRSA